jgi:hypothetical protein
VSGSAERGRTLRQLCRPVRCGSVLAATAALVGCSVGPSAPAARPSPVVTPSATHTGLRPAAPPVLAPPRLRQGSWRAVGAAVRGLNATYLATIDHGQVALLWMNPTVLRFRFIPGTQVPESGPTRTIDNQPSTWLPRLAAAFNGGFWLKDLHPGGYFYDATMVKPLVVGQAAMVVTTDGRLTVGMWGRDLRLTRDVAAVRENLPLLVDRYRDRAGTITGRTAWGRSSHGPLASNRSALGQLSDGSLVYEYGYQVTPEQMAQGMLDVRARMAIMLDLNGSWPGGFVYWHRGSQVVGEKIHPLIYHDPSMYYTRWRKDFVVALLA